MRVYTLVVCIKYFVQRKLRKICCIPQSVKRKLKINLVSYVTNEILLPYLRSTFDLELFASALELQPLMYFFGQHKQSSQPGLESIK